MDVYCVQVSLSSRQQRVENRALRFENGKIDILIRKLAKTLTGKVEKYGSVTFRDHPKWTS